MTSTLPGNMGSQNIELQEQNPRRRSTSVSGRSSHSSPHRGDNANDEPDPDESVDEKVAASFVKFMYESTPPDALPNASDGIFCWHENDTTYQVRGAAYTWAKNKFPKPLKPMLITPPTDDLPQRFRDTYVSNDSEFMKTPFQGQLCIIEPSNSSKTDPAYFVGELINIIRLWKTCEKLFNAFMNDFFIPSAARFLNSKIPEYDAICFLRYRVRCFVPHESQAEYKDASVWDRQTARLNGYHFRERISSSMLLWSKTPGRPYTIIILTDRSVEFATEEQWKTYGLIPCGTENGVTQFLAMILLLMEQCEREWMSAMDSIDSIVRVELRSFYWEEQWVRLMFDESFKLSKDYFSTLQLLRILTDWVDSTENELESLRREWLSLEERSSSLETDLNAAKRNWDTAIEIMKRRTETVRVRAAQKAEEIKSLRDGLFNATSLREATRSMAINRAIYVFTIITVIYTPVGFLATFWALPVLNNPENGTVRMPGAFWSTFIVIPLLTYGFAISIAIYFGSATVQRETQKAITRIKTWFERHFRDIRFTARRILRIVREWLT